MVKHSEISNTPSHKTIHNMQSETDSEKKVMDSWTPSIANIGCSDYWGWSRLDRSHEARIYGNDSAIVLFHPNWSAGTAAVRGDKALDGRRYYWELHVSDRVFGTSIMFGVGTRNVRLHADLFTDLLGEDAHSWGLSHKGLLWHCGRWSAYTQPFRQNEATVIGLLYDGVAGTLTYYKDGKCLGVAFRDLNKCKTPLFPYVSSTAAKTKITLANQRRDFVNLQDRCRDVISRQVRTRAKVSKLQLPLRLEEYVKQAIPFGPSRLFLDAHRNTRLNM